MELCLPRDDATARAYCWYARAQTPAVRPCQTRPWSVLIVLAVRGADEALIQQLSINVSS